MAEVSAVCVSEAEVSNRILIVDDEPFTREVLKQALELNGYETREAGCATDVWRTVRDGWDPEVVLLDIVMPGRSGLDLLADIKVRLPEVEVVLMTNYTSVESVQGAIRGGAQDFLSKPFTIPQVWDAIERALNKRAVERDRSAKA